jgi:hypothetical protein
VTVTVPLIGLDWVTWCQQNACKNPPKTPFTHGILRAFEGIFIDIVVGILANTYKGILENILQSFLLAF